MITRQNAALL